MEVLSNRVAVEWKQGPQFYTGQDLMILGRLLCGMNASHIEKIPKISVSEECIEIFLYYTIFLYYNCMEVFGGFRVSWYDSLSTWLLERCPTGSSKQGRYRFWTAG